MKEDIKAEWVKRLRRLMVDPTECPVCWRAETPLPRRILSDVRDLLRPRQTNPFGGSARLIHAFLGTGPAERETWYERHHRAYVETGDETELARMRRHVIEREL